MTRFPDGFLWGASTSPHQIEGNNTDSDFWALENTPGPFLPDRSGDACDSFHRWPEDLNLLAGGGLNAYRFGIEWSRIEPVQGRISQAMLDHYRNIIDTCHQLDITPVVTLHHFTSPYWFTSRGGWAAPDAVDLFTRYVEAVIPILEGVGWICTINEPNMLAMMTNMFNQEERKELVAGAMPPPDAAVSDTLVRAHHAARDLLRSSLDVKVGWTIANQNFQAEPGAEELTEQWAWSREDLFIDAAADDDFVGVQAYTRVRIGVDGPLDVPEGARTTLTNWEYYPPAIAGALRRTAQRLPGKPLLVTENGIATSDDTERIAYTTEALQGVADVIADGIDVRGYLHWSWLDNFEWGSYTPTFGLVAVDRTTFTRTPKPSAAWLGDIARRNGEGL